MKIRIELTWTTLAVILLARALAAQPVAYTYDPSGNPTALTVGAAGGPAITAPPQPQLIVPNSPAAFSVNASGSGLAYQWLSNGVPISGATGDSLMLANLTVVGTNLGYFSVIVSNSSGWITSAPAPLWTDLNGNGIPDWWELFYFGNLNQGATGDYDGDGVDNLDEYLEGTNPADPTSFDPRLNIAASHGAVSVSPIQPYYAMGQEVTLTAIPDPGHQFTEWTGSIIGSKPQISVIMSTNEFITAIFGLPLGTALDNTNLVWTTGGNAAWFGQAEVSHDGIGAAQSGPIVSTWPTTNENDLSGFIGEQTWLQTIPDLAQPMQLSFWWNVSSDLPDALSFSIDGVTNATISGTAVGWQLVQTNLASGRHTLTWTYTKGPVDIPTGVPFLDAGWVDQVSLTTTNTQVQSPLLNIALSAGNTIVISWAAPSPGFLLQQAGSLPDSNWLAVTNEVNVVAGQSQVVIAPAAQSQFYRLEYP